MRILITGGTGFVGGRLVDKLVANGHDVILGTRNGSKNFGWLKNLKTEKISWENPYLLQKLCSGIDVVIHAAGMNAEDCASDPQAAHLFNGVSTGRLAVAAARAHVEKFIYLSTAHVYRSPLLGVIDEHTLPENSHPYAASKLAGEIAAMEAGRLGAIKVNVLRLSNVFGRPINRNVNCWMLVVQDLCRQAIEKKQMKLRNSGQKRDFVAMSEVCSVMEKLIVRNYMQKDENIFNVGTGMSQSVLEIANVIRARCIELLGFAPEIDCNDFSSNNLTHLHYKTDRLSLIRFRFDTNALITELDSLIMFCVREFGEQNT
ncbi:SDR family oxidoreductase [Amylibacter sp.]|nr:SDR family oxidoreductase [Amylibacter sp.]